MRSATSQNYNSVIVYGIVNSLSPPEFVSVCKGTRWLQTMRGVLTHVTRMKCVMSAAAKQVPSKFQVPVETCT